MLHHGLQDMYEGTFRKMADSDELAFQQYLVPGGKGLRAVLF